MANRYATKTGNWSDTTVWDGGTLPTSSDIVYANNYTVTINQDIDVQELANEAASGISAGGKFVISGSRTLDIYTLGVKMRNAGGSVILELPIGASTINVNLDNIGTDISGSTNTRTGISIPSGFTGVCNVTVVNGIDAQTSTDYYCMIRMASVSGILNVYADYIHSPGATAIRITNGTTNVYVNDHITSSSSTRAIIYTSVGSLTFNSVRIKATSNYETVSVTSGICVFNECTISGVMNTSITSSNGTIQIDGGIVTFRDCNIQCANNSIYGGPAVKCNSAVVRFSGDIYAGGMLPSTGPYGFLPIASIITVDQGGDGLRIHLPNDNNFPTDNVGSATILSAYGENLPTPDDVREGVDYGPDDIYTGSLAVPPAESVASGVPVDDTTGTGVVKLSDIATVTGSQLAAALS